VRPHTWTSRQRRRPRVLTIVPLRPHSGQRHPFLYGLTARIKPSGSNQALRTRRPLSLRNLPSTLRVVLGRLLGPGGCLRSTPPSLGSGPWPLLPPATLAYLKTGVPSVLRRPQPSDPRLSDQEGSTRTSADLPIPRAPTHQLCHPPLRDPDSARIWLGLVGGVPMPRAGGSRPSAAAWSYPVRLGQPHQGFLARNELRPLSKLIITCLRDTSTLYPETCGIAGDGNRM
jgi:hypothetical protein